MRVHAVTPLLLIAAFVLAIGATSPVRSAEDDLFGIFTTNLAGEDVKQIVSDPKLQMTHPRISPNKKWLLFTRYTNTRFFSGVALEQDGYKGTEIVRMRLDGSDPEVLVPAKKDYLNCNGQWLPDGRSFVWLSTENSNKLPQIMKMDLPSRKVSRMPTPEGLATTDPHVVGDQMVFPVVGEQAHKLWLMNLDGSNARQITDPQFPDGMAAGKHALGDYDPKLSPDGKEVAFMRLFGKEGWRIFIVDLETGKERDLSGPDNIDTLPDWSDDGKLLLFWHANKQSPEKMGLYTMKPDGSARTMIPVPRGYLHGHPEFFPGAGSSRDARIIYRATKAPKLP